MLAAAAAATNATNGPTPPPPPIPAAATRLDQTDVPLSWTTEKIGLGVNVSGDGTTASRNASGSSAQCANTWMQGGRSPLVWTVALELTEVLPSTTVGIVGRNYFPSDWSEPLTSCSHAIVLECGTGRVMMRGSRTGFVLKPLTNGARLNMIMDMQTQELTIELLGSSPGQILSSVNVDGIPAEVTLVAGFCAGGAQSVRVVGCTSEKPEMKLLGKLRKDLWDEDNKVEPLPLNVKKERGLQQQQENIAKMAASLDM